MMKSILNLEREAIMPVQIEEMEVTQAPNSSAAAARELGAGGNSTAAQLRQEVRGMGYSEGAARLSPRGAGTAVQTAAQAATPAPAAAPTQIGSGGATVTTNGSTVYITASSVNINAPVTRASGVIQADSVVTAKGADTKSTAGAGNVW